jgi:exosortase O
MNDNTQTTLSHEQAHDLMLAAADGLLAEGEHAALQHHLRGCEACRTESNQLNALHRDLRHRLHERWDAITPPADLLVTAMPQAEPLLPRLGRVIANVGLLALWVWLYWAVFGYLAVIFSREEFRTNQAVLLIVLILVFIQFRQQRIRPRFDVLPQMYLPGLLIAIGGSVLYLLCERFLDINTLSATLFGLATYGLFGLWMSPRRWQEGLPAALLLIGVLPFGDHLQTFVGYPLRIATANIIHYALQSLGIHSFGADTILVFESGLAQVDLPCSGIKSLWTGMLFLTAATWVERRVIGLRWLGVTAVFGGLLFAANVARVMALVLVGQVANLRMIATWIHVPLGVLAFASVCGIAVLLIRRLPSATFPQPVLTKPANDLANCTTPVKRPIWLVPALALAFAVMALLYTPRPQTATAQAGIVWVFPQNLHLGPSQMSPELKEWAFSGGAEFFDRWLFDWSDGNAQRSGSLLFVTSSSWRGQHAPERCFEVDGFSLETSQTAMFDDDFSARFLLLKRPGGRQVSAMYWLQAADKATDDFASRIWADLSPDRQRWVMVTVLFDDVYPVSDPAIHSLANALRQTVEGGLKGEKP